MDALTSFFGRQGLLPHGVCLSWAPELLWTMVASDLMIAGAYFSIPLAILSFVRQRGDSSNRWLPAAFCAFIFACGITHVIDVWTLWQPYYGLLVLAKAATALVSIAVAVVLWPLIPKALRIPSSQQLQTAIAALQAEATQRHQAEQQALETEQSLAVALASINAGFITTDAAGRVTRLNALAEQVTGWRRDEALGQSLWSVFPRVDRPTEDVARSPIELMVERGITVAVVQHLVAIARDGSTTPLEVRADLTRAADGEVHGLVIVFRDLTSTHNAEAERHRLAAIVESSNEAIVGKTLDGRITSWNNAAQALFGYSAEQAIGASVQMLIPADLAADEMRILADLANGQVVPPFETWRLKRDGTRIAVSVTISPIRNALGHVIGASKIARDVTRRRHAEDSLRMSEANRRFVLDSAQIGEWGVDLASGSTWHSARHDQCFGVDRLPTDWNLDTFLVHVHPDDRAEVESSFRSATEQHHDWQLEFRVLWPDASVHWLRAHGSTPLESGPATRMLGIISDITAQRQAEDARLTALRLEAENRQMLEAGRLKSLFLANMSHELRTPLNAIIGFAELLHDGAVPLDSPKHHEFLGHIGSSGRHLLQLINDVLDLSKVEAGKFEFQPEPVNLPKLVREALAVLHTELQRKQLHVDWQIDPTLTGLALDPARLKQVLYNYLSNAIKFTPAGGNISLRALPEGPHWFRVEVEDDGIGIAAVDLPRLFTEFQQLDAGYNKQHSGTGLGLALTRRLVAAQGGSTGVRSVVGLGSVFHLVLPRRHHSAVLDPAAPEARWLVIEDAHPVQDGLVRGLSAAGLQVDVAATGAAAGRQAEDQSYDAIALGLQLPDQPGLTTLDRIRHVGPNRQTPVRAVTLRTSAGQAAAFAVADILRKPIDSQEVVAVLASLRPLQTRTVKVLVIDDDPLALELMQGALTSVGAQAICRLDARQALREMAQHQPDAIILDLMMPDFDGFATLDALRQMPAWRDIPVFIWTSMLLTDNEYAVLSRSAQAIVGKGGAALTELLDSLVRGPASATQALTLGDGVSST